MTTAATQRLVLDDPVRIVRELAAEIKAGAPQRDAARAFPHEALIALREAGIAAMRVPAAAGGPDVDLRTLVEVLEVLGEADSNVAQMYYIHEYGVRLINDSDLPQSGRDALNRRLVEDRIWITNAFSELTTKTALTHSLKFTPTDGGDWLLNGKKFYCTGSKGGQVFYVSGVTDSGDGIIGFVDTDADGITIHDDWSAMGQRCTASGTTEFDNVRVRADHAFLTEGMGSPESLFGSLGQIMFGAIYLGVARAALGDTVQYVRTKARPWGTSDLERAADDPYKIETIGEMQMAITGAAGALERAVRIREEAMGATEVVAKSPEDRDRSVVASSEANVLCGRAGMMCGHYLFELCGASAVLEKYGYDRYWRNVRTMSLHDPEDYKVKYVGDYHLNDAPPPISSHT